MRTVVVPSRFIARVLVAVGVVIPVTVAVALASTSPTGPAERPVSGPSPHAEAMDGAFSNSSQAEEAVFDVAGLEPGDTTNGTVLVTNEGSSRGMFWLARTDFSDRQGPAGGTLSERLQVTVLDVTSPDAPMLVYTGGIKEMGARPLGFVAPGRSRIYSTAATLLPGASARVSSAPNPFEGSSTRISLRWGAIAGEPPTVSDADESQAPAPDRRAPRLRLEIPERQSLLETGRLTVNVRCDEACRIRATGTLRAEQPLRSEPTHAQGAKGEATPLSVTLEPTAIQAIREALTAGRAMRVELTVTARDGPGNRARATRRIWLRPAP